MCRCVIKETISTIEVLDSENNVRKISVPLKGMIKSSRRRLKMLREFMADNDDLKVMVKECDVKYLESVYVLTRDDVVRNAKKVTYKEIN